MFPVNTIIAWYVNIYHKYEDMIITTLLLPLWHISNILVIMIGKSTLLLIMKISLAPILKMIILIIIVLLVLSMFLPMMICLQMNTLGKIDILLLMMILYLQCMMIM